MQFAAKLERLLSLARAGETERALALFAEFDSEIVHSRELALTFGELLAREPTYARALPVAERIAGAFETDVEVTIALSAGLLRVAERRPPDEPPFEKGAAHLAAGMCQRCFDSLPSSERTDPERGGYLQINMADALRMMGPDHDEDALKAYRLALTIDSGRGGWWFQLGILHKWRGRYREGLEANQRALARLGDVRPVLWNLALCATALGEGKLALEAWAKLGIEGQLSGGGMPHVPGMPAMQLRVATLGAQLGQSDPLPAHAVTFEVVWVAPLSPCHGVVQSPTAREASIDYGDLVLWDGAPVHMNRVEGRDVPVFPLLSILRPGDERRMRFVGMERERGLVKQLAAQLGEGIELVIYDERASSTADAQLFYGKLLAPSTCDLAALRSRLEAGVRARPGLSIAIPALYEALADTPAAGRAHQAWGGLERAAERQGILPARAIR